MLLIVIYILFELVKYRGKIKIEMELSLTILNIFLEGIKVIKTF